MELRPGLYTAVPLKIGGRRAPSCGFMVNVRILPQLLALAPPDDYSSHGYSAGSGKSVLW